MNTGRILKGMCWGWLFMMTVACGKETVASGGYLDESPLVTLHIGTPSSGEVEYTRGTQDASEIAINTLTVYDFLVREHSDGADTLAAGIQYLVKEEGTGTPKPGCFISLAGGATATLSISAEVESKHVFVCVANEGKLHFDSIMQPGVTPIDSLRKTPATRRLKHGESAAKLIEKGAVMTGMTKPVVIIANPSYNIQLYRIMARLDVKNNVAAINNFRLVSVSAENCAATGFLFGQRSDKRFTAEKVDYSALVSQNRNMAVDEELKALTTGNTCGKVLYLYEHRTDSCGTLTPVPALLVTYTLNGSPKTVRVPMQTSGEVRFDIRRNRLYTLVVGDVGSSASTRIVCSVKEEGKEE